MTERVARFAYRLANAMFGWLDDGRGWCEGCGERRVLARTTYWTRSRSHEAELCAKCATLKTMWVFPNGKIDAHKR